MNKKIKWLALTSCTLALTGCATKKYYTDTGYTPEVMLQGESETINLRSRTALTPSVNAQTVTSNSAITSVTTVQPVLTSRSAFRGPIPAPPPGVDASQMPPNPRPGECYSRVLVPAVYKTVTEQVMVQEATEHVEVIPATYKTVQEKVLISEQSEKLEVVPAVYETVTEQVMVNPASFRAEEVPAEYDWVEEKLLVKEATTVWKKGRGPVEQLDGATGDILCLVEVPAEYKTVKRKVLKKAASTRQIEIPAKFETVTKRIMIKPPQTRKVPIPAEYKTVAVEKIAVAEQRKVTTIPAEYETMTKKVLVSAESTEWSRILCETNMSGETIEQLQAALKAAGYDPGTPDGKLGPRTHAAITAYQTENNLATGGLTYETVTKLGIIAK